jgi:hypothetical protein
MQEYRLYLFEPAVAPSDRCARPQSLKDAAEANAIRDADERRRGQYAELWRGPDLVRIFEPDPRPN